MRLSWKTLELCKVKFGKGNFYGFEKIADDIVDNISEEELGQAFSELTENEFLNQENAHIHFSALGQHIFNMMLEPEQYIMVENKVDDMRARLYIRDTYYLCVMNDASLSPDGKTESYIIELLPYLDLVVGSFVHTLNHSEGGMPARESEDVSDICIVGKSWDKNREEVSQITVAGNYCEEGICCQISEWNQDKKVVQRDVVGENCELINWLTSWLFKQISEGEAV